MPTREEILQSQDKRFFTKLQKEAPMRKKRSLFNKKELLIRTPKGGDKK